MRAKRIIFVHEGKANYPELAAYEDHLRGEFEISHSEPRDLRERSDLEDSVLWYIMGYYPRRIPARYVLHDYRSLSVGRLAAVKDRIKRFSNHRPDLRIFLNPAVRAEMGFGAGVPWLEIDMGVPPGLGSHRRGRSAHDFDFVYIGEISRERRCQRMLGAYVERFGASKSFVLVGRADDAILSEFEGAPGVRFTGRVSQAEALDYVARSHIAVCYFPVHRPHRFQTPTKLLEYAAMGKPIVINPSPTNLSTAERYGIRVIDGGRYAFSAPIDFDGVPANDHLDASVFEWPTLLQRSGIRQRLTELR